MSENVEGTVSLDGLLEGRFAGESFTADDLMFWASRAAEHHLHFSVETDGNSFSVLGERRPVKAADIGDDPARTIADSLDALLDKMPPPTRGGAMSTLRSVEYRKGEEVQTLYVIVGGRVDVRQRTIEARTTAPVAPPTRKEKVRMALMGLAVALLVFLASSIFVDYRAIYTNIVDAVVPVSADELVVDTGPFGESFSVVKKEVVSVRGGGRAIVLTLNRGKTFPVTADQAQKLFDDANDLPTRLATESLARGYVRCEFFDKEGKFLTVAPARIAGLRKAETLEVALPLPARGARVAKVVFTY